MRSPHLKACLLVRAGRRSSAAGRYRSARRWLSGYAWTLWLGLTLLRARWSNTCPRSVCGKLIDEVGHESGPAGLVRSTASTAIVTVKIFVEEYVVLEMLVGL